MSEQIALPLEAGADEDEAVFLPHHELSKRFTAEQVQQIKWKKEAVIMTFAAGWPIESIVKRLGLSHHTVRALVARECESVAGSRKEMAQWLAGLSARWFGLARLREGEASALQLATAAGIAFDKSVCLANLNMMGQGAEERVVKEADDHVAAAAALRRLLEPAPALPAPVPGNGETTGAAVESAEHEPESAQG